METWPAEGLQTSQDVKLLDNTEEALWSRSVKSTSDREVHKGRAKIKFRLQGRKLKSRISMQFYIQSPGAGRNPISVRERRNRTERSNLQMAGPKEPSGTRCCAAPQGRAAPQCNGASQSYSSSFPRHVSSYITLPLPLCWIQHPFDSLVKQLSSLKPIEN